MKNAQLKELADAVFAGITKCYIHSDKVTPNTDVGLMLIEIHKQLTAVINQENVNA